MVKICFRSKLTLFHLWKNISQSKNFLNLAESQKSRTLNLTMAMANLPITCES